jgi:hypothetical protein
VVNLQYLDMFRKGGKDSVLGTVEMPSDLGFRQWWRCFVLIVYILKFKLLKTLSFVFLFGLL